MNFTEVETTFLRLKNAFQAGKISANEFEKQVNSMFVVHQDQRWMIGVSSGKWYRHDGARWVEDTPPVSGIETESSQDLRAAPPDAAPMKPAAQSVRSPDIQNTAAKPNNRWLFYLGGFILLIIVAFATIAVLMLTKIITPPARISGLLAQSATQTPAPVATTLDHSPTPEPSTSPTHTPSPVPIIYITDLAGAWSANNSEAFYHFYNDSSFVYFNPEVNDFAAGNYTLQPNGQLLLEAVLGNQITDSFEFELTFDGENAFTLENEGTSSGWQRIEPPLAASRFNDPVALLYELSYRLEWEFPDPNCEFDSNDEETEFHYVCLDDEEGLSMTWVNQAFSNDPERKVERNLITISVDHESQPAYEEQIIYIQGQMESAAPFHDLPAFTAYADMNWFAIEEFAWQESPWAYSIFRLNAASSPNPAPGLMHTAETIFEILQGDPPHSSPATIPTERPVGDFIYDEDILGSWKLEHPTTEIITFEPDGTIAVTSELGQYDYSGTYYFTSDNRIVFDLDAGIVKAGIQLDGDVMTLNINGVLSVYERVEESSEQD